MKPGGSISSSSIAFPPVLAEDPTQISPFQPPRIHRLGLPCLSGWRPQLSRHPDRRSFAPSPRVRTCSFALTPSALRCSWPARRPYAASLPVRVPTVEVLPSASFSFTSRLRLAGWLRLAPSPPSSSFQLDRSSPCREHQGRTAVSPLYSIVLLFYCSLQRASPLWGYASAIGWVYNTRYRLHGQINHNP